MSEPVYSVGIDLGTSNCAMAAALLREGRGSVVRDFAIMQLVRLGETAPRPLFPSAIYLKAPGELPEKLTALPWTTPSDYIEGEFARWHGGRVPSRLITSAKSWLCHPGVDRTANLLPWGAPADVPKISPVQASALLLEHMKLAWDTQHPHSPLAEQDLVITVPASFDEAARALTVNAARHAGLEKFTLIEEPQAAFYHFTSRHRQDLGPALENVRLVLVIDVGGGTSDFTLVEAAASPEGPLLRRIAVGEHLILGGDNMDASIARAMEERMVKGARKLTSQQWSQLLQQARLAKESQLAGRDNTPPFRVSILAEGSQLLGGGFSAQIDKADVEKLVLDGFFPNVLPGELPRKAGRTGIHELGLPFAQDPAITRQIAGFLHAHAGAAWQSLGASAETPGLPRPDAILLNGGVFNSPQIRQRLVQVLSSWWPEQPEIPLLEHDSLDLAVARGAAYYGLVRRGFGQRIGGGAAHAFYVGLRSTGETKISSAVCVIPRAQEEDQWVELTAQSFNLALGRPVQFPIFTTASDRIDRPGQIVELSDELKPLPPLHTILKSSTLKTGHVPVHLRARLTEIGTLELWCVADDNDQRWRLEFELRQGGGAAGTSVTEAMPKGVGDARLMADKFYGGKGTKIDQPREVKQLWSALESKLGSRETWSVPVLRELWASLHAGIARRRRSSDHERVWFQLTGYTLRPGLGYPLDEWRSEQTWVAYADKVQFHREKPNWTEFWICWRRIAGGLTPDRQQEIWNDVQPHLQQKLSPQSSLGRPKGVQPEGWDEMLRMAASLEHLAPDAKTELGTWIIDHVRKESPSGGPWAWSLGRLGARVLFHGSNHQVVSPVLAARWLDFLLAIGLEKLDGASFAAAQISRRTGDRSRDLDEALRKKVVLALQSAHAPESWITMVQEVSNLSSADEARALGDTLPAGLQLIERRK